jgi:hypothetical protein
MALAYAMVERRSDMRQNIVDITLDGSYAAGGYALDNPSLGIVGNPTNVDCNTYVHATATNDFVAVWDPANNKVKVFKSGTAGATLNECVSGDITTSHKIRATVTGTPRL